MSAFEERVKDVSIKAEAEENMDEEEEASSHPTIDLTEEPLSADPRSEKERLLIKSMGVTDTMDTFFSSMITFVNVRTEKDDTERETFSARKSGSGLSPR